MTGVQLTAVESSGSTRHRTATPSDRPKESVQLDGVAARHPKIHDSDIDEKARPKCSSSLNAVTALHPGMHDRHDEER